MKYRGGTKVYDRTRYGPDVFNRPAEDRRFRPFEGGGGGGGFPPSSPPPPGGAPLGGPWGAPWGGGGGQGGPPPPPPPPLEWSEKAIFCSAIDRIWPKSGAIVIFCLPPVHPENNVGDGRESPNLDDTSSVWHAVPLRDCRSECQVTYPAPPPALRISSQFEGVL